MKAILVCVDYADLLAITLPYNRHHFSDVVVVTTPADTLTHEVADDHGAKVFTTNSFFDDGATFNKFKALEEGLDWMGREGWLCIMDADVLWPKWIPDFRPEKGKIYTPKRRMLKDITQYIPVPMEGTWKNYPYHWYLKEWSGYTQIFHTDDPALGDPPWFETDWVHAGGPDSFFQMKWPDKMKLRPPFEVLHLGDAAENWMGRVSPYIDGSVDLHAEQRKEKLDKVWRQRRQHRGDFSREKIS